MDRDLDSKIRALALAARCLNRGLKDLRDESRGIPPTPRATVEAERLVGLARMILDPSGLTRHAPPRSVSESLLRAFETTGGIPPALPSRVSGPIADAAPSLEHALALFGHGTVLPIPELIGFLGTVGKTGILRVSTAEDMYVLEFHQGDIVHGEMSRMPKGHRLGDVLVEQGALGRSTLEDACADEPTRPLGRLLLEKRLIQKEHLTEALRAQIQWLFNRLFREEAKNFTFWIGPPINSEDGVRLNTTSLLLEGARSSDEADGNLHTVGEDAAAKLEESS